MNHDRRTHYLKVRLTEDEYEELIYQMKSEGSNDKVSSFVRQKLFLSDNKDDLRKTYIELRGMHSDISLAIKRLKAFSDKDSSQELIDLLNTYESKISSMKEVIKSYGGNVN